MNNIIEDSYNKYCTERFPLPTEQEVRDLELKIGRELPDDYRDFILQYNGGFFSGVSIGAPDDSPDNFPGPVLTVMYGAGDDKFFKKHAVDLGRDIDLFDDNDPLILLPIGYTALGQMLIFVFEEEESENVSEFIVKLPFQQKTFFLAETVEELFELFEDFPT